MAFRVEKTGNLDHQMHGGMVSSTGNDDKILLGETGYGFMSAVALDYFSRPSNFTTDLFDEDDPDADSTKEYLLSTIKNKEKIELIPRNSIIAHILDDVESLSTGEPYLCYPFFPSNLSLPVKPGEHVWVFAEKNRGKSVYYWVCRKTAPFQIEDVNHTILDRYINNREVYHANERVPKENAITKFYNFHENTQNPIYPAGGSLTDIIDAAKATSLETIFEPVPSIISKAGDVLFQGTNNAYIHLTTEKFTSKEACNQLYPEAMFVASENKMTEVNRTPFSPAIDISVASYKNDLLEIDNQIQESTDSNDITAIYETENLSVVNNSKGYHEINKANDNILESTAPDLSYNNMTDPLNCGGRIYMSNNCAIDEVFKLEFGDLAMNQGSSLGLYTDHMRLLANKNIKIVTGDVYSATEEQDDSLISYIEFKADNDLEEVAGNIIIKPYHEKSIYLGHYDDSKVEPAVLGDTLMTILEDLISAIGNCNVATPSGPSGIISAGPGTGWTELQTVKESLVNFKSDFVKLIKNSNSN